MPNYSKYVFFEFHTLEQWQFGIAVSADFSLIYFWKLAFVVYASKDSLTEGMGDD